MHMPAQVQAFFFFDPSGDELSGIAGYEVGGEAGAEIAEGERDGIQTEGQDPVGDAQPDKELCGIDVLEDAAVGVAVVAGRGKIGRLAALRQVAAHGDGHGIAEHDGGEEGQDQVAEQGIGAASGRQPLDAGPADQAGDGIEQDQKQKDLRQQACDPGEQLPRFRIYYTLQRIDQKHAHVPLACPGDIKYCPCLSF